MATVGNYGSDVRLSPERVMPLAGIEDVVLGPLRGVPLSHWQRAPSGKWTPAQIVEHLALAFELSVQGFQKRAAEPLGPRRRKTLVQRVATFLVFTVGRTPRVTATRKATPPPHVEAADAERHFHAALTSWRALSAGLDESRRSGMFIKHPRLGDLDVREWERFHVWHCHHHAEQIAARLAR